MDETSGIRFLFTDYQNRHVGLTKERLSHINEHPEMEHFTIGQEAEDAIAPSALAVIEFTLAHPEHVVRSQSDTLVYLYYRMFKDTNVGNKYMCVVVKVLIETPFVITAYLTDKVKTGESIWTSEQ